MSDRNKSLVPMRQRLPPDVKRKLRRLEEHLDPITIACLVTLREQGKVSRYAYDCFCEIVDLAIDRGRLSERDRHLIEQCHEDLLVVVDATNERLLSQFKRISSELYPLLSDGR